MNVVRPLSLIALSLLLGACASKPAQERPVAGTVVDSTVTDSSASNGTVVEGTAVDTAVAASADAAPVPADAAGNPALPAPTDAEDDFAALYGGPQPSQAVGSDGVASGVAYDPWEGYNRKVHRFNDVVDRSIARPLATGYTAVVPRFARTGVTNFFTNLRSPLTLTNQLLQGRPGDAWNTLGRFLMNSTFGIAGLFDPASKAMVPRRSEDFGQTLGVWGWRQSRYFELPFFGPRTVRDVFGLAGDMPLSPIRTIDNDVTRIGLQGLQLVDTRAQLMALDDIRDSAVDEYALTRDAWLQRRTYQIERDLGSRRGRQNDEDVPEYLRNDATVPVDAMPIPTIGN